MNRSRQICKRMTRGVSEIMIRSGTLSRRISRCRGLSRRICRKRKMRRRVSGIMNMSRISILSRSKSNRMSRSR